MRKQHHESTNSLLILVKKFMQPHIELLCGILGVAGLDKYFYVNMKE